MKGAAGEFKEALHELPVPANFEPFFVDNQGEKSNFWRRVGGIFIQTTLCQIIYPN